MPGPSDERSPSRLTATEYAAWAGFLRLHALLPRRLDAELRASHGLGLSSYEVLVRLMQAPSGRLRLHEVAASALLTQSGMSRLVDRLVHRGMVSRADAPDDGRGCLVVITERGREHLSSANLAHLAAVRRDFLDRLTSEEQEALGAILQRLAPGGP